MKNYTHSRSFPIQTVATPNGSKQKEPNLSEDPNGNASSVNSIANMKFWASLSTSIFTDGLQQQLTLRRLNQ